MKISLKIKNFYNLLLISLIIILLITSIESIKVDNNLIENYYSFNPIKIELDQFISGNITEDNINYYQIALLNDTEEIFFDYQSGFGCLYIYLEKNDSFDEKESDYKLCSKVIDSLFTINKKDILDKIGKMKNESIKDLNIILGIGHLDSETNKRNYTYSLKVSVRKPDINIFEINSENKILCKTETKKYKDPYKCLFVITYNNNNDLQDKNLIIYPISQLRTIKLNIYVDFINKEDYNNWNVEYLKEKIPNNNSKYNNYNLEQEYVYIPINDTNKYIYICIESEVESIIEMISHIFYRNEEIKIPKINEKKLYNINNSNSSLDFSLVDKYNNISISLVTLSGKAKIYWEYDNTIKYISDIRENLLLNMNPLKCINNKNKCNLIINNLEYSDKNETNNTLGYIFCISYSYKNNSEYQFDEILYGKSIKLSYENIIFPIMLYSQIKRNTTININLQFYNISELSSDTINIINNNDLDIKIEILKTSEIYDIKQDFSKHEWNNPIIGSFDSSLFASNIYLSPYNISKYGKGYNPWIFIYISKNGNKPISQIERLILGSTITEINSLIKPSERIYHYGKLYTNRKVVYRLGGKSGFHLMRLEIGTNFNYINWSVSRKKHNDYGYYYKTNDSDISFVTEKWINGRGLITMYIENGEDIYLTIYNNYFPEISLTSYTFKYINAKKNTEFKNYYIKKSGVSYIKNNGGVKVEQLKGIVNSNIYYYLKIIDESDYLNRELINSISIMESNWKYSIKGEINNNQIYFPLKSIGVYLSQNYFNVYSHIISDDLEIVYISYNGYHLYNKDKETNYFRILFICLAGIILFLFIIIICCIIRIKRRRRELRMRLNQLSFRNAYMDNYDDNDDDDLLLD